MDPYGKEFPYAFKNRLVRPQKCRRYGDGWPAKKSINAPLSPCFDAKIYAHFYLVVVATGDINQVMSVPTFLTGLFKSANKCPIIVQPH